MPGKESLDDVRIGDFSRPLGTPDKSIKPAKPDAPNLPQETSKDSPTAQRLDDAEARIATEIDRVEKDLTPLERYEKMLKSIGVSREEAAMIVDEILTKGYWEEEAKLTPLRRVKLRTRSYRDLERFYQFVELEQPKNTSYYNELLYKYSLAASLATYDGKSFTFPDGDKAEVDKAFQARLRFVESLPEPAIRLLYARLGKFDEKIRIVTEEGAIEGF
jgi:hypothetical protein